MTGEAKYGTMKTQEWSNLSVGGIEDIMPKIINEKDYLVFRGRPLVREGDTICYGNLNTDKYVLMLEIFDYKEENGHEVPSKVLVQIVESDNQSNIVKQGQKDNIYDAFSMGVTWLELQLGQKS